MLDKRGTMKKVIILLLGAMIGFYAGLNISIPLTAGLQLTGDDHTISLLRNVIGSDQLKGLKINTVNDYLVIHGGDNIAVVSKPLGLMWVCFPHGAVSNITMMIDLKKQADASLIKDHSTNQWDAMAISSGANRLLFRDRDDDGQYETICFTLGTTLLIDTDSDGNWDYIGTNRIATADSDLHNAASPQHTRK